MFVKSASFIRIICSSDGQSIFDILNVVFLILYCCRLGRPTITAQRYGAWRISGLRKVKTSAQDKQNAKQKTPLNH
jgi:hypothetical protein